MAGVGSRNPRYANGNLRRKHRARLKAMGCDIIQGYYFSRPLPADEFEKFFAKEYEEENLC